MYQYIHIKVYNSWNWDYNITRPYHTESTNSHLIIEVKQCRAGIVLCRHKHRHKYRQTDRQTDTHAHTHTHTHTQTKCIHTRDATIYWYITISWYIKPVIQYRHNFNCINISNIGIYCISCVIHTCMFWPYNVTQYMYYIMIDAVIVC